MDRPAAVDEILALLRNASDFPGLRPAIEKLPDDDLTGMLADLRHVKKTWPHLYRRIDGTND